jgi:TRAP-type transport system small permease protein
MVALRRLDRSMRFVSSVAAVLAAACGLVIVLMLSGEVLSRAVRGTSIAGSYELSELLLVALVFLGLAQAERSGTHVRSAIVTSRLPERVAARVRCGGCLVATAIVVWMALAAAERAQHSIAIGEFRQGLIQFPIWPARVLVVVGLVLLAVELLLSALKHVVPGLIAEDSDAAGERALG